MYNYKPKLEPQLLINNNNNKKDINKITKNDLNTYSLLLNHFDKLYNKMIIKITRKDYEHIDYISIKELNDLLYLLGFVDNTNLYIDNINYGFNTPENNENNNNNNDIIETEINNSDKKLNLKKKEKNLIFDLFELLNKKSKKINLILLSDLYPVLISILNLYKFKLFKFYKLYIKEDITEEIKNIVEDEQIEYIINKCNESINKNFITENYNKYISYDNKNEVMLNIENSNNIRKKFEFLGINYISNRKKNVSNEILHKNKINNINNNKNKELNECNFNPIIDKNSEKIYINYYNRLNNLYNNNNNGINNNINSNDISGFSSNNNSKNKFDETVNRLMNFEKKKKFENERKKDEKLKNELKDCTFSPNKNNNKNNKKKRTMSKERINELYKNINNNNNKKKKKR